MSSLTDIERLATTRRQFFGRAATGIGAAALGALLGKDLQAAGTEPLGLAGLPHHPPTAKRVIYLFMSGGPSQMETFDHKPALTGYRGQDLPESIRKGQRLTGMTSTQLRFPVVESQFAFAQHGQSGAWVSELLPHTAKIVDELCIIKSMQTDAINHDPAVTFFQTGSQIAGRPSMGAWATYGLGSECEDLPGFVVLVTRGTGGQPLYDRLWGSGFLPTRYQGVKFRSVGDPVLYLSNPPGIDHQQRRRYLDALNAINRMALDESGEPEIATRIAQYEMAYRMQTSVPDLTDLSAEPEETFRLYGEDARTPGTFAANCLLARRLAERDVRFIQLYHRGWDQHNNLPSGITKQCKATDQASAALVMDLKRRGLLDDTLVIWGGEFGRTVYCQGRLTDDDYGRDHHPRCFPVWMAGGGVKPGMQLGETDDYSYNVVADPVHVHDLQATILHTLGVDHTKLTYRFQGRAFRLTDVHGNVVKSALKA
ncbi:MAG: DUF1501 domain-containing protein [Acidobacteria bacterium]|nr:DUF1501 domain-containing protein [Acidobacteriota bacterium]MDA1233549.1 DUF1501 domain-containing protein [Acidobacteriota bacterium]